MPELVRFGVSMDGELLEQFDALRKRRGYATRSEALRDLVRERLVQEQWQTGRAPAVGALCLVFDHAAHDLAKRVTQAQHKHVHRIISTLHVHLDSQNCLEVIVLRGRADELRTLADQLMATRGVKHGQLVMTTTGRELH